MKDGFNRNFILKTNFKRNTQKIACLPLSNIAEIKTVLVNSSVTMEMLNFETPNSNFLKNHWFFVYKCVLFSEKFALLLSLPFILTWFSKIQQE